MRLRAAMIGVAAAALSLSACTTMDGAGATASAGNVPQLQTAYGAVTGTREGASNDVNVFRGIRYAATTEGRRFQLAADPEPWTTARPATEFGSECPQRPSGDVPVFKSWENSVGTSEDCLFLNVWTRGLSDGKKRPIMVWLHGGGYVTGSGSSNGYDGSRLAERGDVVVVTLNHRLNGLGYSYLAGLSDDPKYADSGNLGSLDIVKALEWVRDHADEIGGDAGNVTIFGESGGAAKVSTLMGMEQAKGLFQRAGVMSGSALRMMPPEMASATAKRLLDALEIAPGDVRKLQQVPWTTLLETQAGLEAADRARGEAPRSFAPVVDGITLPRHPWDPDAPSISADVPMIVSSVLDERSYRMGDFAMDEAGLLAFAKERLGERAADAVAAYRAEDPDAKPFLLAARMDSDLTFRKGAFAQAELKARQGGAPVWTYLWTEPSPAVDGRFGAVHGIDVAPSLYNTRGALNGSSPSANELAAAIAGSWAAFAANGDPNNERVPEWKPYSAPQRTTMIFDQDLRVEDDPRAEFRKYWR